MRIFALSLTFALGVFTSACDKGSGDSDAPEPAGCTKEAMICPDGSSVGRTGPDCEFAPCPGEGGPGEGGEPPSDEGDQIMCTMDAKICPDGSAVGRSGPDCEFAPCPGE
jgi:hypothetical protein